MRSCLLLLLAACARDVHASFPAPPGMPTGQLVLLLSDSATGVSVAIDGRLVAEDEHTQRVTIDGVPVGTRDVVMTANGGDKQMKIWVDGDRPTTIPVGVATPGYGFLETLAGTLITIVVYTLLHH